VRYASASEAASRPRELLKVALFTGLATALILLAALELSRVSDWKPARPVYSIEAASPNLC